MTCPHCTGSHYLADTPDLGPCVCCTPAALTAASDALQRAEATVATLTADKPMLAMLDELEGMCGTIRDRYVEMEAERDELREDQTNAAVALAEYLVSIGLPAEPVTLDPGPLRELAVTVGLLG